MLPLTVNRRHIGDSLPSNLLLNLSSRHKINQLKEINNCKICKNKFNNRNSSFEIILRKQQPATKPEESKRRFMDSWTALN